MLGIIILILTVLYIGYSIHREHGLIYFIPGDRVLYDGRYYGEVIEDMGMLVKMKLTNQTIGIIVEKAMLKKI